MSEPIKDGDTIEALAYRMLGDSRLAHEIVVPGWHGDGPLPVGRKAYLKDEKMGPPSKNWTQPR